LNGAPAVNPLAMVRCRNMSKDFRSNAAVLRFQWRKQRSQVAGGDRVL